MGLGGLIYGDDLPEKKTAELGASGDEVISRAQADAEKPMSQDFDQIDQDLGEGQKAYGLLNVDNAIKEKYKGLLSDKLNDASRNMKLNARVKRADTLKRAQNAILAKTQIQNDIFMQNLQYQNMQESARASALNSILGFGGTAGGYFMAASSYGQGKPNAGPSNGVGGNNLGDDIVTLDSFIDGKSSFQQPGMNRIDRGYWDQPGMQNSINYRERLRNKSYG